MRHIGEPPFCHPPHRLPQVVGGCLGVPAVLPHMHNIPRAYSDAAWAILAWGVALSCQHSVHFLLQETHSKCLLWVSRGFGLLLSRLWGSAIADLGVGWLPSRRKSSLCVGDSIVSAFSLLSFAWLMLSHWCVLLTVAPHFGMNSLRSGFTFPSGLKLRMSWMSPQLIPHHPRLLGTHLLPPFLPAFAWYFITRFTQNCCPVSLIHQWLETLFLLYEDIFPSFLPVLAKGRAAVTAWDFSVAIFPSAPKSSSAFVHFLTWHLFLHLLLHKYWRAAFLGCSCEKSSWLSPALFNVPPLQMSLFGGSTHI